MKISGYVAIVYALLLGIGGFIGFRAAHSTPSLVMGTISALVMIGSGIALLKDSDLGRKIGLSAAVILLLFFGYRYFLTRGFFPAGFMSLLSLAVAWILWKKI